MDLPDKSGTPAAPKPDIPVVGRGAKLVKRPATRRFRDFLLAESPKALLSRVAAEVLVPRAKAGLEEAANSFLSGMLWGDGPRPVSNIVKGTVLRNGAINYNGISLGAVNPMSQAMQANQNRSTGNYQDLLCPTQQIAERYLANLYELLNSYNRVAVADLYEMAGITPAPSDDLYGWTSLDGARISKTRDGFLLELPRPMIL